MNVINNFVGNVYLLLILENVMIRKLTSFKIIYIIGSVKNVSLLSRKIRGVIISLVAVGISFVMSAGKNGHLHIMRLMTRTED